MRSHPSRAFTLIELLVVISIIALLVAILLPGLQQARATAQAAVCMSNQRQIALAMHTYANDFDDYLPPYRWKAGGSDAHWNFLISEELGYLETPVAPTYDGPVLVGVFSCPTEKAPRTGDTTGFWFKTNYGVNAWLTNLPTFFPDWFTTRRADIFAASDACLIGDSGGDGRGPLLSPGPGTSAQADIRHNGTWNVGYVDGHAGVMDYIPEQTTPDGERFWADHRP